LSENENALQSQFSLKEIMVNFKPFSSGIAETPTTHFAARCEIIVPD